MKYCLEYRGNFLHRSSFEKRDNCCRLISYSNRFANRTIENCLKVVGKCFDFEKEIKKRKGEKRVVGRRIFDFWEGGSMFKYD